MKRRAMALMAVHGARRECTLCDTATPLSLQTSASFSMIGWVPEEEGPALEITYNYGIESYKHGNDFRYANFV